MKNFKKLREQTIRQQYRAEEVFNEGDIVMSTLTGQKGRIHRRGVNYVIAITESGEMFRAWINDIRSVNVSETINRERNKSKFLKNEKAKDDN